MAPELFPYQIEGAKWLRGKRHALLADQPGLGKSAQAIEAAKSFARILVVCPAVAVANWHREFKKFDPTRTSPPIVVSYDFLIRHAHEYQSPRDLLILDEAHFLKSPTASRTKAVFGRKETGGLIHSSERTWLLTGTPAPNNASELWVFLFTFGMTRLSYDAFVDRYCNSYLVSRFGRRQIVGTNLKHVSEIKTMLAQISLRRLKADVLKELPPIFHSTVALESHYDPLKDFPEMKDKLGLELERMKEALGVNLDVEPTIEALEVLAQSVSTLRRYHGLKKVAPVVELVTDELLNGHYKKIVLFCVSRDVSKMLVAALSRFNPVFITGETPQHSRQAVVDRFQTDDDCQVFVGNIRAAGTAITLTAANQVAFVESEWTPADMAQAADRCHRIGQKDVVNVRHFALAGSIDEKIAATLSRKAQELSHFILPTDQK